MYLYVSDFELRQFAIALYEPSDLRIRLFTTGHNQPSNLAPRLFSLHCNSL